MHPSLEKCKADRMSKAWRATENKIPIRYSAVISMEEIKDSGRDIIGCFKYKFSIE